MIHHVTRATRHLIFWSLIAAAVGLTSVRLLLSGIDDYKADVIDHISELLGAPVTIGHIGAKMRGFKPELVLKEIAVLSVVATEKPAIQLKEIRLGLNLLDALVGRDLLSSSWVTLVGAKLSVTRKQDGSFAVVGLKTTEGQPLWLFQGRKYEVLHSEVIWHDEKNNGRMLKFAAVDIAIMNDEQRHRINMLMNLPQKLGGTIRVSMDLEGNVFEPSAIRGVVFVEGRHVNPAELVNEFLPSTLHFNSGLGDFKLWSHWQQSQLMSVQGETRFQRLKLVRQDKKSLAVNKLDAQFNLNVVKPVAGFKGPWQLDVRHFLVETGGGEKHAINKDFSGSFNVSTEPGAETALLALGVFVSHMDLQEASELIQFFAPSNDEQVKFFKQFQLKGELENFSVFIDENQKRAAVNGDFAHLSFAARASAPGLENLTGHISGSDLQGSIGFSTRNARLTSNGLFRDVLSIDKLEGTLAWRQTDQKWEISGAPIELNSPDIQTTSRMQLIVPKNKDKTILDLQGAFVGSDVSKAWRYLPTGIMKDTVVAWLDHAFIGGKVPQGGFLFHGRPQDFPFSHGEGVFETLFDVEQMELAYHPEWPRLTDVNAEVLFFQNSLHVKLHQGQSNKLKINQADVTIPVLGDSQHLLVKGKLEGTIGDTLDFLQQTPIKAKIDPVVAVITAQGDTQLTLDLKIPLLDEALASVDGTAQLSNANLNISSLNLPVTHLQGMLKFNEQGISSDSIDGVALGYPIQIAIKNAGQQTDINVKGHSDVDELKNQFKLPWWTIASGETDYDVQVNLPTGDAAGMAGKVPELIVKSTLAGMELDLPGILAKRKEQKSLLSLTFRLMDEDLLLPLVLNYDNKLKAAVKINVPQQTIYSGHVLVGEGEVAQRQGSGLELEINRDQMPLQDWLSLAGQAGASQTTSSIRKIKIHSDHALWHKSALGVFDLALEQVNNRWHGAIACRFASGNLSIPAHSQGNDKTLLDMDMLDISALKQVRSQSSDGELDVVPETLPLFNVVSNKTLWNSIDLGHLTLETERMAGGIAFKTIELTGPDEKLVMSGDWTASGKQSVTRTRGHLDMANAGRLLAQLGITKDMAETVAALDFNLVWDAAPFQVSLAALKGQIDVNLKSGRLLSIEPGFGRVLGVLAMAQWIKRLQLDFSDIYEAGLTFNTIKGRFDLINGKAVTNNLVVDAIPAKITIAGNTDLVGRTVDHIVNVTPKSADALPIAGTIVGKMAKLLAKSLTGEDHEGFLFGSQYLVKGEWGNAQIIPLHENDGLLQKTWNGITAFPWLEQQKNNKERSYE